MSNADEPRTSSEFDPRAAEARLKKWFPDLSPGTVERLVLYLSELLRYNKTTNLIPQSTIKNAEAVHIADSILASRLVEPMLVGDHPLYDFGSGNGCPGIV